jgi:DNA-binding transcriptional regulator LsrR (DeoR family)
MRAKPEGHDALVVAAAKLCVEGNDQETIASRLHISQPSVSRLLKEAKKCQWLIYTAELSDQVPSVLKEEAEKLIRPFGLTQAIRRTLKPENPLRNVMVYDSGSYDPTFESMLRRLVKFGRAAATRVAQLLKVKELQCVGVTWGRTLDELVSGLAQVCPKAPRRQRPIQFVPLCGEPMGESSPAVSSSRLTVRLDAVVNAGKGDPCCFTGVPFFIPPDFKKPEREAVEKMIRRVKSYARVFPPQQEGDVQGSDLSIYQVGKLEMILTSVGPSERALGFSGDQLVAWAGINRDELKELVVGDLGGVLLPKPGLSAHKQLKVQRWNESWTGVQQRHLRWIVEKTAPEQPGIVVIAVGRDKVRIVLEVLRAGLCHELLIDHDLAEGIEEEVRRAY